MKLAFGKYNGVEVRELPSSYLTWIVSQAFRSHKYEGLFDAALSEIETRIKEGRFIDDLKREQLGTGEA